MSNTTARFNRPLILFAALTVVLAIAVFFFVPTIFGALVTMWLLLSIPVGIAVGHCVLGRDDDKRR